MGRPRSPVRRRRIDQATEDELRRRQGALTALGRHDSWEVLQAEVERRAAQMEKIVLAKALGGAPRRPVDPNEMQWMKGFVAGMRWFAAVPTHAEASLRRYLEEQGITLEGDEQ